MLSDAETLNARILIVDDQSAHVHLLERLLGEAGYLNVSATVDPQQVLALHREHHYDLILLDLQMPVLDGFGVMEALRGESAGLLPVIALTAQPGHKLRALKAGARDFINKPFDTVEVKLRIHHMLEMILLQKKLELHNQVLECTVEERTAALLESERRYRSLTELAADWYWEQNDDGELITGHGPLLEMLGYTAAKPGAGWDIAGCQALQDKVAARQPFLDFIVQRQGADGSSQRFRISGEPTFDRTCRVSGFRGVGTELLPGVPATHLRSG
jgi:CheY-like chemotaxis protein